MNIIDILLKNDQINDFGLLFLTWLKLEGGSTSRSQEELSRLFKKHPVNIHKQIKRLADDKLIVITKLNPPRTICLSDFVKKALYNYNIIYSNIPYKENNNNIGRITISDKKINVVSQLIMRQYIMYDVLHIKEIFKAITYQDWKNRIQRSSFGKAVLSAISDVDKSEGLRPECLLDVNEFLYQVENTLKFIFQNTPFPERNFGGITDSELKEQERQRKFDEQQDRARENQFLDLNDNLEFFQSKEAVNKLGKLRARLTWARQGGMPPMGNLHMKLSDGSEVNATITNDVYKYVKEQIQEYVGSEVMVRGKIVYNTYYERNILQNTLNDKDAVRVVPPSKNIDVTIFDKNISFNDAGNFDDDSPF